MKQKDKPSEDLQDNTRYIYRWNYSEQLAHDTANHSKRHGAFVYAMITVFFFLACIGSLIGVLFAFGTDAQGNDTNRLTTADVAERVNPAVVLISVTDGFSSGYGSGFFIRSDGYIATNAHVVGEKTSISVTLYTGEVMQARLIGKSIADDLAVIKISGKAYPTVAIGNSDTLRVGESAIAIGHPSGTDAQWSTTQGIVSALNRKILIEKQNTIIELTMLQTDAPVNSGNSGGPLCNANGEVIGIVTRKLSETEGIGLALPINGAIEILNAIVENGSAKELVSQISRERPTMGIAAATIQKGDAFQLDGEAMEAASDGVIVTSVTRDGAADGILQVGDIILFMDGNRMSDMESMVEALYSYEVGDTVELRISRKGTELTVIISLGVRASG